MDRIEFLGGGAGAKKINDGLCRPPPQNGVYIEESERKKRKEME